MGQRADDPGPRGARMRGAATPGFLGATALVVSLLVPLLFGFVWTGEARAAAERERYGSTLVSRLAAGATDPLLAGDRIALSVLTREFTTLEGVATAAVYGADDRLLAAADGARISPAEFDAPAPGTVFVEQITLQDSIAGYARLGLDPGPFAPNHVPGIAFAIALGLLVLAAARVRLAAVAERFAALRERVGDALDRREDEVPTAGSLLRLPVVEGAPDRPRTAPTGTGRSLYLVVVNVFNQISLSAEERTEVVEQCEELLERVCRLYGGRRERLPGTGLVLVLDALADEGDHAFQAVCVALLAARVFEGLNLDRSREGRMQLALRVGVERVLDEDTTSLVGANSVADACPDSIGRAVTLSALARERAVVVSDDVHGRCAQTSRLVAEALQSPALRVAGIDAAWLVRDLAEGYRGLLDRQAKLLLAAS